MKALKYIFFILIIILIGLAIYIAVQPNEYKVTRERVIHAAPEVIYNQVIDFKSWESWSPWIEKNPDTQIMLAEKTSGTGGSFSWKEEDGIGNIKTIETVANTSITQEMQFDDFEPATVHWQFQPLENNKTKVTWSMQASNLPFMFKAYAAFNGGFEKMLGPDFERGLELLDQKVIAEIGKYSIDIKGITEHGGGFYIYKTKSSRIDELQKNMIEIFPAVINFSKKQNISMAGAPFVNYHKWDANNNAVIFSACVPTTSRVIITEGDILTGQLEGFKSLLVRLQGDYNHLQETWDTAMKYVEENKISLAPNGPMLEVYLRGPDQTANPAAWITELYLAVE